MTALTYPHSIGGANVGGADLSRFSLPGFVIVSTSGVDLHPTNGTLVALYATLTTAGSTATVLAAVVNGGPVVPTLTIPAGQVQANVSGLAAAFVAFVSRLQISVTTAGVGALDLVTLAVFSS